MKALVRWLRPAVPLLLLGALVAHVGTDPFAESLRVLAPAPVLAALLLGGVATVAQAMRWRAVAGGMGRGTAVRECYRSTLLNAVLPGGVMGDAVRAWRQRGEQERGLRESARSVLGERLVGTAVLLLTVAAVTVTIDARIAAGALGGALVAVAAAAPALRRIPVRAQLAVWGWSALALASLAGLFAVAAAALGTVPDLRGALQLGLLALAGMSIPAGIGGFGPREAVSALAFGSAGLGAAQGVATAAAYGVLVAVSALPGVLVMLLELREVERPAAQRRQVQLDAHVLAQHEPAARCA